MESYGGKLGFFLGLFIVFHILSCSQAQVEKIVGPTGYVNLAPFQQWRNAYRCLKNTTTSCQEKYRLTTHGWVNVTFSETTAYCKTCAPHTMAQLTCLRQVKHDYTFQNKANVQDLNDTIRHGCASGFNGITKITSGAGMMYQRIPLILVFSSLVAYFLI